MTDNAFREITFTYRGEEYTMSPSVAVLQRIKAKGINTTQLANQCAYGGLDYLDLAEAAKVFLAAAGKSVTADDALEWLTSAEEDAFNFLTVYVRAAMPGVNFGKKPEAPEPTKRAPKKTAKKKPAT